MIVLLYVTIKHIYRNILTLSRIVFAPCPVAWNLSCAHVWRLLRGHAAGHVAVAASARYRWRWGTGGTAIGSPRTRWRSPPFHQSIKARSFEGSKRVQLAMSDPDLVRRCNGWMRARLGKAGTGGISSSQKARQPSRWCQPGKVIYRDELSKLL
jgi:hypothetical protein